MNWDMLAAIAALGIAGIDPIGALIVIAAIALGAQRGAVLAFFASSLAVTLVIGIILEESVHYLVSAVITQLRLSDTVRLWLQLAVAAALAAWSVWRYRHRRQLDVPWPRRAQGTSTMAMFAAGTLWGIASLTDPTFYATAALIAQDGGILVPAILLTVWFVVSQLPLCAVTAAYLASADGQAVERLVTLTQHLARAMTPVLTVLIAVAALLLVASSATYLATGTFLPV